MDRRRIDRFRGLLYGPRDPPGARGGDVRVPLPSGPVPPPTPGQGPPLPGPYCRSLHAPSPDRIHHVPHRRDGVARLRPGAGPTGQSSGQPVPSRGPGVPHGGPVPRRPVFRRLGGPGRCLHVLHGDHRWWDVEDRGLRRHLESHLGRVFRRFGGRCGCGHFRSQRDLRRGRVGRHPGQYLHRAGCVEVHGCGEDLGLRGARRCGTDRPDRSPSTKRGSPLSGRSWEAVREERDPWGIPVRRWGRELGERPVPQRFHRRSGPEYEPAESPRDLRRDVACATEAMGHGFRRSRRRRLQDVRRGGLLEEAGRRTSGRDRWQGGRVGLTGQSGKGLGHHRSRAGRRGVSVRRRR